MDIVEEIVPLSYPTNLIEKDWSKRKFCDTKPSQEGCNKVHNMEVFDDDVWVVTLPKSGTTWMQELVWLVMNDFNFDGAKSEHLELRCPFLDHTVNSALSRIEQLQPPRLIKSHFPLPLLPKQLWDKKPKVIYVFRNPKDAWVSLYFHYLGFGFETESSVEKYVAKLVENKLKLNSDIEHAMEFYQLRHEPWLFYTSYERMKKDLAGVLRDICQFLNKPITDQQMQQMLHHLSFKKMKKNPTTNHLWELEQRSQKLNKDLKPFEFVRKGEVNGYKDDLSPELITKLDRLIEQKMSEYNITLNELLLLDANEAT